MDDFFLGVFCTLLAVGGGVGVFFSVLGNSTKQLMFYAMAVAVAVFTPFFIL